MRPYYLDGTAKCWAATLHGAEYPERGWHDERHGVDRRWRKRVGNKAARRAGKRDLAARLAD